MSKAQIKKYRNISPAQFGVGKNQTPGTYFPLYTLFSPTNATGSTATTTTVVQGSKTGNAGAGANITVDWLSAVPNSTVVRHQLDQYAEYDVDGNDYEQPWRRT